MTINLSELLQILPDVMLLLIPGYFYWYCYNRMNATYYNAYHENESAVYSQCSYQLCHTNSSSFVPVYE